MLAHELGHGVHAALAAPQGIFHQGTPLTLAETASVFGEALTFGRLLEASPTPPARLALLAEDIEGAIATVFRQVAMNRFEDARPHRAPRGRRARRSSASASCGRRRRPTCSATPSRSPTTTAAGGPTSRTSSARRATSTRTPTASCSRCRSTSATSTRARASRSATSSCWAAAARAARGARRDRRHRPARPGLLGPRPRSRRAPPRARPRRPPPRCSARRPERAPGRGYHRAMAGMRRTMRRAGCGRGLAIAGGRAGAATSAVKESLGPAEPRRSRRRRRTRRRSTRTCRSRSPRRSTASPPTPPPSTSSSSAAPSSAPSTRTNNKHFSFTGHFSDKLVFPASSLGSPLTLRVVIKAGGHTVNLDCAITAHK